MFRTLYILCLFLFHFTLTNSEEAEVGLTTKKGPIVGLRVDPNPTTGVSYDAFLGIPYGQIPARFQVAVARSSWTEPLSTKTDGPVCPQLATTFSEDCLYLNVFTPMNASSTPGTFPVMVYIHGAAFTFGSSSSKSFGPDFLVNASVILVAMNYRLSSTGFLTLGSKVAPGNLGLHDTLLALQWVQDEISVFGGDPTQVTLFGQSSGSAMVQMHYLSPLTTNLFKRVIAESGSVLAEWTTVSVAEATRRAKVLADAVGCDSTQNDTTILSCLQSTDINYIVGNQSIKMTNDEEANGSYLPFIPVLDNYVMSDTPFFNDSLANLMIQALNRSKPMITGFNSDEGILKFVDSAWNYVEDNLSAFIPKSALPNLSNEKKTDLTNKIRSRYFNETPDENKVEDLVTIYTDFMFAYPSVQMTRYFANLTYGYLFGYDGSWAPTASYFVKYKMTGVSHGDELDYLFYVTDGSQDLANCSTNLPNIAMKDNLVRWWTNFAKTGVPDSSWQPVAKGGYLIINKTSSTMNASDFESRYYNFWASMAKSSANSILPTRIFMSFLFFSLFIVKFSFCS